MTDPNEAALARAGAALGDFMDAFNGEDADAIRDHWLHFRESAFIPARSPWW